MPSSRDDVSHSLLSKLENDLGYPEGSSPQDVLASILAFARDVIDGEEAILLVPPDRLQAFAFGRATVDEQILLAPMVSLSSSSSAAESHLAMDPDARPRLTSDKTMLIAPTPSGALLIKGSPQLGEVSSLGMAVVQLLAIYASSSMVWASQLYEVEQRASEGEEAQHDLRRECARLRELSEIDDLTGLYNRRFFKRHLEREVRRFQRYGHPLSLALIDVDHFKDINDTYGHLIGDQALCHLSKAALSILRESDLIARVGGDEFAVLMPDTPTAGGARAGERLLEAIASRPLETADVTMTLSLSIGIAGIEERSAADPVSFFKSADAALYLAKEGGRGRVAVQRKSLLPSK